MKILTSVALIVILGLSVANLLLTLRPPAIPLAVEKPVTDTKLRFDGVYWDREEAGHFFKFFPNGKVISSFEIHPIETWFDKITFENRNPTYFGIGNWVSKDSMVVFSKHVTGGEVNYMGFVSRFSKKRKYEQGYLPESEGLVLLVKSGINGNQRFVTYPFFPKQGEVK